MLPFSDGITIDTSGPLRPLHLADGWYVVGGGLLIPVADRQEAEELIQDLSPPREGEETGERHVGSA